MPSAFYSLGLGLNGVDAPIRASNFALGGLLDQFPEAVAAYSLRSLRNNDGNEGVVIEMTDDCTYQPTYYTPAQLTDGTLDAYLDSLDVACGRSSVEGHVTKWYDQSGYGRHATQSNMASAPKIVSGGQLITNDEGKPAIQGATNSFFSLTQISGIEDFSVFFVGEVTAGFRSLLGRSQDSDRIRFGKTNWELRANLVDPGNMNWSSSLTEGDTILFNFTRSSGTVQGFANSTNSSATTSNPNTNNFKFNQIFRRNGNNASYNDYNGKATELIIYDSNQSSNRTAIEDNINAHYEIYS